MGEYRNGPAFNVIAGFTVVATSTLSILLLAITSRPSPEDGQST